MKSRLQIERLDRLCTVDKYMVSRLQKIDGQIDRMNQRILVNFAGGKEERNIVLWKLTKQRYLKNHKDNDFN